VQKLDWLVLSVGSDPGSSRVRQTFDFQNYSRFFTVALSLEDTISPALSFRLCVMRLLGVRRQKKHGDFSPRPVELL